MNKDHKKRQITCIVCPESCEIIVKEDENGKLSFSGHKCKRGIRYAREEYFDPRRILTTTVIVRGGELPMLPTRSRDPLPKNTLIEAMDQIADISIEAPIHIGDIVCDNLAGTEISLIASRNLEKKPENLRYDQKKD